jgi:hypothetical protein
LQKFAGFLTGIRETKPLDGLFEGGLAAPGIVRGPREVEQGTKF